MSLEFYESNTRYTAFFYESDETRMVPEGVCFDRIFVLTVLGQAG